MKPVARAIPIPKACGLGDFLASADFSDAYAIDLTSVEQSALELYLRLLQHTPAWVLALMRIRNRAVVYAGLRNLGGIFPDDPHKEGRNYQVGDRIGIFTITSLSEEELIMSASDVHLETRCSVLKRRHDGVSEVILTSAVHIRNRFGVVYMAVVGPMHKLVVRAMLEAARL